MVIIRSVTVPTGWPRRLAEMATPSRIRGAEIFTTSILPIAIVLCAALYSIWSMAHDALFLPWPGNPDEFPYVQEVLRFTGLDFRQQFFDIPGTPLMFLTAGLWTLMYWSLRLLRDPSTGVGLTEFSFQHIQTLFVFLRVLVLFINLASIVLLYALGKRLLGEVGGLVAALLLTFSWVYSQSGWYIRIEPLAVLLVVATFHFWISARQSGRYRYYLLAGLCAGLSMAVRFPVIVATVTVLCADGVLRRAPRTGKPQPRRSPWLLPALAVPPMIGAAVVLALRAGYVQPSLLTDTMLLSVDGHVTAYPRSTKLVGSLWLGVGLLAAVVLVAELVGRWRRRGVGQLVDTPPLLVCLGVPLGFLMGTPTVLWSGRYLLRSIELFVERNAYGVTGRGFVADFADMVALYWNGVARTPDEVALLIAGIVLALVLRTRVLWPLLIGASIGILSQWGKLQTERHLLAWFPYFYLIMAYPAAVGAGLLQRLTGNVTGKLLSLGAALAIVLPFHGWMPGIAAKESSLTHIARSGLQSQVNEWLLANTDPGAIIFHVCCDTFNDQVIFDWMAQNGLSIPTSVRNGRNDRAWFGDKQSLLNVKSGYCIISRSNFKPQYIDYYSKMSPDRVVDPTTDRHFTLRAAFPSQDYTPLEIYQFSFGDGALD
jgi:Dolichyl-phosphate-mannose-protein mannosyltransferase